MVVILVLISSVLGFASAVTALVFLDATLLQAFILWMCTGFGVLVYVAIVALQPHRGLPDDSQVKSA